MCTICVLHDIIGMVRALRRAADGAVGGATRRGATRFHAIGAMFIDQKSGVPRRVGRRVVPSGTSESTEISAYSSSYLMMGLDHFTVILKCKLI